MKALIDHLPTQLIASDAWLCRRWLDPATGMAAIPLVLAGASANRCVLAQVKETSAKITVISDLFRALAIADCIIMIDGMPCGLGCQRKIAP